MNKIIVGSCIQKDGATLLVGTVMASVEDYKRIHEVVELDDIQMQCYL